MKSFKQFMNGPSILSYDGSFASLRNTPNVLNYDGSFASNRDNTPIKEEVDKEYQWTGRTHKKQLVDNKHRAQYDSSFHDHPDIIPKSLTPSEKEAIHHYTVMSSRMPIEGAGSSPNINNYCRNCNGDKNVGTLHQKPSDVKRRVLKLYKAFRPENMNRSTIHVVSAIPDHIGQRLINAGSESDHILPGFTSTTTDESYAKNFAKKYTEKSKNPNAPFHIMRIKAPPESALTFAHHSGYSEEELVLRPGTHITYHGTTEHEDPETKKRVLVHHVTVNPSKRIPIEQWGQYDHPKETQ